MGLDNNIFINRTRHASNIDNLRDNTDTYVNKNYTDSTTIDREDENNLAEVSDDMDMSWNLDDNADTTDGTSETEDLDREELENKLTELKELFETYTQAYNTATENLGILQTQLQGLEEELAGYQEQFNNFEARFNTWKAEVERLNGELLILESKKEDLIAKRDDLVKERDKQQSELDELNKQLKAQDEKVQNLTRQRDNILRAVKNGDESKRDELEQLNKSIATESSAYSGINSQILAKNRKISALDTQIDRYNTDIDRLQITIDSTTLELNRAIDQRDYAFGQMEKFQGLIDETNGKIEATKADIETETENQRVAKENLDKTEKEITETQEALDSLDDGALESIGAPYGISINGVIDSSAQGQTGDCWLIAGLNELSYSAEGAKLIKNSVTCDKEGNYVVKFKGVDWSCKISPEEFLEARNSGKYSTGDDDVLLFEIAVNSFLNDCATEEFQKSHPDVNVKEFLDYMDYSYDENGKMVLNRNAIEGGYMDSVVKLFKKVDSNAPSQLTQNDPNKLTNISSKFEISTNSVSQNYLNQSFNNIQNNRDKVYATMAFSSNEETGLHLTDINGMDIPMTGRAGAHAWSVKSVDGDIVTLVNPWDSQTEVSFTREELSKPGIHLNYMEL